MAAASAVDAGLDLLAGQVADRLLDVRVVGRQRGLELGVVEVEQRRRRMSSPGVAAAVLLDRRLLELGIALEAERLREAHDGRGGGVGAAGELLGRLEGGLVEVVDDVAGDVLLRARELVEALGDVGRERLAVGAGRCATAVAVRRAVACGWPVGSWSRSCSRPVDSPRVAGFPSAPASAASAFGMWLGSGMDLEHALRLTNRNLIVFDLALGTGALLAPDLTLRVLGHDEPSPDARHLFRRCGPIWLTFAAAHAVADVATSPRTGGRWPGCAAPRSPPTSSGRTRTSFSRPGARLGLWLAGGFNLAVAVGFGWLARERSRRPRGLLRRRY